LTTTTGATAAATSHKLTTEWWREFIYSISILATNSTTATATSTSTATAKTRTATTKTAVAIKSFK